MSKHTDPLEVAYAAPSAVVAPTSPRAELLAAAEVLRSQQGWLSGQLALWLADTATVHGPDDDGRTCFRDGDSWPCFDVQAAQKVAFAVGYEPPAP
ncbi:hypothetical protein [Streptomyces sp. NPDC002994]|uniref:hypothetical protein n=1 Tax=Streptomyces sp. NPDC002994 TaxID=3154441 RepID=UPI0033B4160F